jgi:MFS family permease
VDPSVRPSPRSLHALDWLNFFVSDVRTGVGPFIAVYLTQVHWNVLNIGVALTIAEIAGVITQAPGGAIVDRLRSKRLLLALAVAMLAACSLSIALFPQRAVVYLSQFALGVTGSIFGPGISAITLGLVGYACLGQRTGRNAGFGSAGNVIAAVSMGLLGYFYSTRAIFYFVALISIPTLIFIVMINPQEIDYDRARGGTSAAGETRAGMAGIRLLLRDRRLRIFTILTVLFHLGNGAMLALPAEIVSQTRPKSADIWLGAFVTVPQIVMILIGPLAGRIADKHGRKPILLFGFLFLPLRAVLFALTSNPEWLTALQILDGISAGIFLVVGVLMIADCSQGTGHYNLALGTMGAAVGIGASISTMLASYVVHRTSFSAGFLLLAAFGLAALLVLWLFMPETKLNLDSPPPPSGQLALQQG